MLEMAWSFIAPLGYLALSTATLVFLTKRSFGKCLPLAMIFSAFLLFFSQLIFKTFTVGFVIGIVFALCAVALGIIKRREWKNFCKLYFTSGFWVFLTVYVLVFIYDLARGFSVWDEFSHWGMMVKEMMRLDQFYSVDESNLLVHKDYPPIMQLFELFWTKLCGGFSEAYVERALHTFELSLFIPFIAEKVAEKKNVWKSILVGVAAMFAVAFTVILFDQHGVFATIYTDYVMALIVVWLLMMLFVNKEIGWFEIVTVMVGGSFLLLLKQMGLPLYLMVVCFLIGVIWLRKKEGWKKYLANLGWKKILATVVALLIPFVVWFIWGRVVEGVAAQFSLSELSLTEFLKVLVGHGEEWQSVTVKNYVMALGQENISTSWLPLTYVQGVLLFVGVIWLVWWVFRKRLDKKETILLGGILVFGAVGYAVAMLALYVLAFGSYEGPTLASFNRYMGTYLMVMLVLTVTIVIWQASELQKRGIIYAMAIGLAILTAPEAYKRIYPYIYRANNIAEEYGKITNAIRGVAEDGDKIFLVTQDASLKNGFYLQYYLTPIGLNYGMYTWLTDGSADGYYFESVLPAMKDYDYLFIMNADEEFNAAYCKKIGACPVAANSLYEVVKDGDGNVKTYNLMLNF